jgi:hypothetical protein
MTRVNSSSRIDSQNGARSRLCRIPPRTAVSGSKVLVSLSCTSSCSVSSIVRDRGLPHRCIALRSLAPKCSSVLLHEAECSVCVLCLAVCFATVGRHPASSESHGLGTQRHQHCCNSPPLDACTHHARTHARTQARTQAYAAPAALHTLPVPVHVKFAVFIN